MSCEFSRALRGSPKNDMLTHWCVIYFWCRLNCCLLNVFRQFLFAILLDQKKTCFVYFFVVLFFYNWFLFLLDNMLLLCFFFLFHFFLNTIYICFLHSICNIFVCLICVNCYMFFLFSQCFFFTLFSFFYKTKKKSLKFLIHVSFAVLFFSLLV